MILQVDCKGALDLTYVWNVRRLTKHVLVHACFLHELKEPNLLLCVGASYQCQYGGHVHQKHVTTFVSFVINAPSCVMKMMMTRNAINIFTRYWTFPTSQSPILQGRVLDLVELNLLWELAPRHYQFLLVSMMNLVENRVDCWMEVQEMPKISISVVWGRTLQKLTKV